MLRAYYVSQNNYFIGLLRYFTALHDEFFNLKNK